MAAVAATALACLIGIGAAPLAHARSPGLHPETVPYVTQPGDTLYDVAQRYLGDMRHWRVLARLNRVAAPRQLRPGTSLKLPVALLRREALTARIVAMSGQVARLFGNTPPIPVVDGASFSEGDRVSTGGDGFATFELADGTHVSLPPNSTLQFGRLQRTVLTERTERIFNLQRGEVDSEVTHAKHPGDRFEIHAPSIVAGVRGTHFRVNYEASATQVEVLDGTVAVDATSGAAWHKHAAGGAANPDEAVSQLVPARYGSVTRASGGVGAPVPLLTPPELVEPAKVQSAAQVAFDLTPLTGASRYRVQIARDADLLDLIREVRVDAPHATFDAIPDGTYFVRISAIDADGLEGLPHVYAFERRQSSLMATASLVAGTRDYEFRWLASRAGVTTHYRFVLSRHADLREPVVDTVDLSSNRVVVANLRAGTYYWTVVAEQFENGRFYETTSPVRSFTLAY